MNPLKPVCIAGLVLSLIVSWGMVFFGVVWKKDLPAGGRNPENTFARELKDYDLFDAPKRALAGEKSEETEKRLSRLQREVRGVEEQLSVLKRRRILARIDRRFTGGYVKAAREAAEKYPYSAPLAVIAADAVIGPEAVAGASLSGEAISLLGSYASRISQNRFGIPELGMHVLAGNLADPARAAAIPGLLNLLELLNTSGSMLPSGTVIPSGIAIPEGIRQALLADEFLLRVMNGDISAAFVRLNTLLRTEEGLRRMAAEFFYDHGNYLRAAELFTELSGQSAGTFSPAGEKDLARAADALLLAGETAGARNIWLALPPNPRNFYNLAASSAGRGEQAQWLERIFALGPADPRNTPAYTMETYSVIRYTRLLGTDRSIAVLSEALVSGDKNMRALLDLELHRRRLDSWNPTRAAAEAWLLLGRNPEAEALHEWAAWYFDHQRLYGESSRLLGEALRKGMEGSWLDLHRGLAFVRERNIAEAEKILKEAGRHSEDWRIPANLGRIQESRRAISAAAEYYEKAVTLAGEKPAAAQIQLRLSRCLEALGRGAESRRALETALELDPDNLNIRRELRRFESR